MTDASIASADVQAIVAKQILDEAAKLAADKDIPEFLDRRVGDLKPGEEAFIQPETLLN